MMFGCGDVELIQFVVSLTVEENDSSLQGSEGRT